MAKFGRQGSAAIGQGLANLGAGIGEMLRKNAQEKADAEQAQKTNNIIQRLLKGGETQIKTRDVFEPIDKGWSFTDNLFDFEKRQESFVGFQPDDVDTKANLLLGLDDKGINRFRTIKDELQGGTSKQDYYQFDGKLYRRDQNGKIDFSEPVLPKDIGTKDKPFVINPDPIYDSKTDRHLTYTGYKDPDGNFEYKGERFTLTKTPTGYPTYRDEGKGKKLNEKVVKEWEKDARKQQELLGQLKTSKVKLKEIDPETGEPKRIPVVKPTVKGNIVIEEGELSEQLNAHNRRYAEKVKNGLSKDASDWYRGLFNAEHIDEEGEVVKAKGENPHPDNFWDSLKKGYIDGSLGIKEDDKETAYIGLVHLFIATYGFDPRLYYKEDLNARR